ncbi:MAG: hypothetical protein AAGI11_11825 [Pseudomonadota bacterium]
MNAFARALIVCACLALAACATSGQTKTYPPLAGSNSQIDLQGLSWWGVRFKMHWPADEPPDLSGHLLLAEQVLQPVILEHEADLQLWRFHRRARRDGAGNQFSLIFLADDQTAKRIDADLRLGALTQRLENAGMLDRVRFEQLSPEAATRLDDTSDPSWPESMQRSWPWFIMGASQAWLIQLQSISQEQGLSASMDYAALTDHYAAVAARMNEQWRSNARHAYFHHLSAIYGYQPVQLRSGELKRF